MGGLPGSMLLQYEKDQQSLNDGSKDTGLRQELDYSKDLVCRVMQHF